MINPLLFVIVVLIALVIFIVVWIIRCQNRLVHTDELCGNALSQVGVQQASRWDALSALADLCKAYSDQEYRTLMDTIAARKPVTAATSVAEAQQQENLLAQSFGRINAVAEAYPELKSNSLYLNTMNSVKGYEEHVRKSRMVFNDTVTKYNRLVRAFPNSLAAGILGFRTRAYLEDDPAKAQMPTLVR